MALRRGRSTPEMRAIVTSALTLLVTRVRADDAQHSAALHDFALVANLLHTRPYLHDACPSKLLDDLSAAGVTAADLDRHSLSGDHSNHCVTETRRKPCGNGAAVGETDAEESAW